MGKDRTLTERQKYGLGEMLAEIGGLYSALFAGFGYFSVIFGHFNLQFKMAQRLYEVPARPTARNMIGKAFIGAE
jgi:hypothetical protein